MISTKTTNRLIHLEKKLFVANNYSIARNTHRPYVHILILDFFQALQPYQSHYVYKFWNFPQCLQIFSSLMGFLQHKFAPFVHALRLFKALRLFFLTNFPGPTVIPCPTSIPDSRVIPLVP